MYGNTEVTLAVHSCHGKFTFSGYIWNFVKNMMKFDGYVTLYVTTAGMLHVYLNRPPNTLYLRVHVKPAPPS